MIELPGKRIPLHKHHCPTCGRLLMTEYSDGSLKLEPLAGVDHTRAPLMYVDVDPLHPSCYRLMCRLRRWVRR